jgi:hypothetical protein
MAPYAVLKERLESDVQMRVCKVELWNVNHFDGWQSAFTDPAFRAAFAKVISDDVNPALRRYGQFLKTEYLPRARDGIAVSDLPDGSACYQAFLRANTTLNHSPQEVIGHWYCACRFKWDCSRSWHGALVLRVSANATERSPGDSSATTTQQSTFEHTNARVRGVPLE